MRKEAVCWMGGMDVGGREPTQRRVDLGSGTTGDWQGVSHARWVREKREATGGRKEPTQQSAEGTFRRGMTRAQVGRK